MLYLEDYIELIEQLPQDLRDRFTDMRELDLKVQNNIDTLDSRVRRFFTEARKSKPDQVEEDYKNIHQSYKQALDNADEKVSMASQIYDLVDRHLRKLDQELSRFKMELEADCSGITEILERRSVVGAEERTLDLLYNSTFSNTTGEPLKRKFGDVERLTTACLSNGLTDKLFGGTTTSYNNPLGASYPPTKSNSQPSSSQSQKTISQQVPSKTLLTNKSLITSTNPKEQGRTAQASLKAMNAAQKKAEQLGNSLSMSGLLSSSSNKSTSSASSTNSATSASFVDVTGSSSFMTSSSASQSLHKQNAASAAANSRVPQKGRRGHKGIAGQGQDKPFNENAAIDWVPDPNEPTYCLCNQVSYGEMVGCDNPSCPIEWFHYGCVGLTDAPKGKWYCPDCSAVIKKRRMR
ncbi:inhibitor of growth protein 3-like [Clytia hemisphaerica]|uniref:Inhibitor of growth protein n=1 Tax=Clytia hemisphaerica TaxID=252671 RepID=A0A7M5TQ69_9CNID|eukprot:TCONS_00051395-protein